MLHVDTGGRPMLSLRPRVSWSLWQTARLAVRSQGLPSTQHGRCQRSRQGTRVGPDQEDASQQQPRPESSWLWPSVSTHTLPQARLWPNPRQVGPGLSLREAKNGRLPHQAPLIIRKKPQGPHLTFTMVEGRPGPKQVLFRPKGT